MRRWRYPGWAHHGAAAPRAFVDSVRGSLDLDNLGERYVRANPQLIPANADGFYLPNSPSGRLIRVVVEGGVERYVRPFGETECLVDPPFRSITSGGIPFMKCRCSRRERMAIAAPTQGSHHAPPDADAEGAPNTRGTSHRHAPLRATPRRAAFQ